MKTMLDIPFEHYSGLLAKCESSKTEYIILKNGIILPNGGRTGEQTSVAILCEPEEAKKIFDLAKHLYPEAVPHIHEYASE
jgi:hypothetical protein